MHLPERFAHLARLRDQFRLVFEKRRDHRLHRRDLRREREVRAHFPAHLVLAVCIGEHREEHAPETDRRLDDVRHKAILGLLVQVREIQTARLLVTREVEIGAVVRAPKLFRPLRECEVDVVRGGRVVRALVLLVLVPGQARLAYAEIAREEIPRKPSPRLIRFSLRVGTDEVLHLHLFELADTEDEIARGYLVPERLPYLRDTERQLRVSRVDDILEIREDGARSLRSQVRDCRIILNGTDPRLHHHVVAARRRERLLSAGRARGVLEEFGKFRDIGAVRICQVVRTEPSAAALTVDERVGESGDVAGRFPKLRVLDYRAIDPEDVIALLHHTAPPELLQVVLELDAHRTEIVEAGESAINLARRKYEPAAFGERDYLFHEREVGHMQRNLHEVPRYCTVESVGTYPGSPVVSVVTAFAEVVTCTPE